MFGSFGFFSVRFRVLSFFSTLIYFELKLCCTKPHLQSYIYFLTKITYHQPSTSIRLISEGLEPDRPQRQHLHILVTLLYLVVRNSPGHTRNNLCTEMKLHPSIYFCSLSQLVSVFFSFIQEFSTLDCYLFCVAQYVHRPHPPYFVLHFVFYGTLQHAYQRTEDIHKVVNKAKLAAFSK